MAGGIPKPFNFAGQGQPSVVADAADALIWQSGGFGGTTDWLAVNASANGGGLLWNPANSGVTVFVYGLEVGADVNAVARVGLVTGGVVPTGYATAGTQIQPKHLQTGGAGLRAPVAVLYQNTAAAALTSFLAAEPLAADQAVQPGGVFANAVLRPATGLIVVVGGPVSAWHFVLNLAWAEYQEV